MLFIDYYKVLSISPDASTEEIKEAYHRLVKLYHPDINKEADAVKRFIEIQQAYEVLVDPIKRKDYDDKNQTLSIKTSSPVEHRYIFPNLTPNSPITLDFGTMTYFLISQKVNILLTHGVLRDVAPEIQDHKNYCHRCRHVWEALRHSQASRTPKYCPKCRADDWSEFLLMHCHYCFAVFKSEGDIRERVVEDQKGKLFSLYELFSQCPSCKRSGWCFDEEERLRVQRKKAFRAAQQQIVNEHADPDISPDPNVSSLVQTSHIADSQPQQARRQRKYSRRLVAIGLLGTGFAACFSFGRVMLALKSQTELFTAYAQTQLSPAQSPDRSFRRPYEISAVAWSPNEDLIAYSGPVTYQEFRGIVSIFSHKANAGVFSYYHVDPVASISWASNGVYMASISDGGEVQLWDITQQKQIATYASTIKRASILAWSPDNKYIISGTGNDVVQVWDYITGKVLYTFTDNQMFISPSAAWSPNGKRIASSSANQIIKIWDAPAGGNTITCTCSDALDAFEISITLDWSPNNTRIVSGANNIVQVWNADNGEQLLQYKGHSQRISCIKWSPNGNFIASGSWDKTVRIWNINSGEGFTAITFTGQTEEITDITWSPNSQFLVLLSNNILDPLKSSLRILNVSTGQVSSL